MRPVCEMNTPLFLFSNYVNVKEPVFVNDAMDSNREQFHTNQQL